MEPEGNSSSPPTFNATVNDIRIPAGEQSKVTGVTLYTARAEVTREIPFSVVTGQNKATVIGLSSFIDWSTMRVEGRGAATIQGVTVSDTPQPPKITTSPVLESTKERREEVERAVERCRRSREAVHKYLSTLDAQHVDGEKLNGIISSSEENLERLDNKLAGLQKELDTVQQETLQEERKLNPPFNSQLRKQVEIGLFAERDGEVVLVLKYATVNARWNARYDVRVNTQTKEKSVKLIYQATVVQGTAEDWTNVPVLLETNTPTYSVDLPTLPIETLGIKETPQFERAGKPKPSFGSSLARKKEIALAAPTAEVEEEDEDMGFGLFDEDVTPAQALTANTASVHNQGVVSTAYKVPGLVTIPCDNNPHNITIVELDLDSALLWVTVPKMDARAHLQARIKNASDYILLGGSTNIYVDGAFHSSSSLSMTNPQETFSCSLGLDPAVRITYHPCVEKLSQSGLINKTATKIFTQRIAITNTKLVPIETLKVVDGIPVSKDARIVVKLKSPELSLPNISASGLQRTFSTTGSIRNSVNGAASGVSKDHGKTINRPVPTKISSSPAVSVQWHGAEDENVQVDALGQDGRINWIVSELGSMGVVNLTLSWDVAVAEGLQVVTTRT